MDFSICDSELNIMNIVWEEGGTRAVVIAHRLREEIGWSLNNAMDFANSFFENVPLSDEEKSAFIQKMKENA